MPLWDYIEKAIKRSCFTSQNKINVTTAFRFQMKSPYRQYKKAGSQTDDSRISINHLLGVLKSNVFISGVIAVVTFAIFAQVLKNDFVMWDDDWLIYKNPTLGGISLKNLHLIFANVTISSSWYTPLTGLRWSITYQYFHLNPFGYHLGNLLFHTADAVLIFFLIRKLLILGFSKQGETGLDLWQITVSSATGALFWSLHPLRVETVAWASAGAYGQALFFLLISLLCYLHAEKEGIAIGMRFGLLSLSVISFSASLLCQPIGMGFAVVFFVLDVYLLGRLGGRKGWCKSVTSRRVLWEKLPFFIVSLVVAIITVFLLSSPHKGAHSFPSLAEFGLLNRVMQAMYIWTYYAWRPFYPIYLAPVYTSLMSFDPFSFQFIASGLAVVCTMILLVLQRHRWPFGLALAIFHLVILVPNLGLFEHPHFHVDRYSIIVSIGLSVLLSALLAYPKIGQLFRSVLFGLSIAAITTLGLLSLQQTHVWNNSVTLFEHMLRTLGNDPFRHVIHWRLGNVLAEKGKTAEAVEHFQKTLEIRPDHHEVRSYLAYLLATGGKIDEAIMHYRQIIRKAPDFVEAYYNLGVAYAKLGKLKQAVIYWTKAVEIKPDSTDILNNLARILATSKDDNIRNVSLAVEYARSACELTHYKDYTLIDTLAIAYAAAGRLSNTIETLEKAITMAEVAGDKDQIRRIQKQLQRYNTGRSNLRNTPLIE